MGHGPTVSMEERNTTVLPAVGAGVQEGPDTPAWDGVRAALHTLSQCLSRGRGQEADPWGRGQWEAPRGGRKDMGVYVAFLPERSTEDFNAAYSW